MGPKTLHKKSESISETDLGDYRAATLRRSVDSIKIERAADSTGPQGAAPRYHTMSTTFF